MRIITLETLMTMPNGTVFCETDEWGNLKDDMRILTGRFENKGGFNGEISLYPWTEDCYAHGAWSKFENGKLIKNKDFPTEWKTDDKSDFDYDKDQLFAVFSKSEIAKMIKVLQWALSDLTTDFDMDEVIEESQK